MKIAFRHIQNNCVLCHANKLKDVDPMGECMPIMVKFVICVPVALVVSGLAYRSCRNAYEENKSQYVLFQKLCKLPLNYVGKRGRIEMFILRCTVIVLSAGISNRLTPEYIL